MTQILVAEDEARVAAFVEKGLRANGFATVIATTGPQTVTMALEGSFDLVILDLGLPVKDGLAVLEELRGQGYPQPIIILTARDEIEEKVTGFDLGASDYMTKPFRFEELLARIRVRLQTYQAALHPPQDWMLSHKDVALDVRSRQAKVGNQQIDLSAREFILLETFMRHVGQVLSREQLLDRVWGYDYDPGSNVVDVYVGYLRKKLGTGLIETVRGMGYRMEA
jgi:DNA-binding response OmpR family regulator